MGHQARDRETPSPSLLGDMPTRASCVVLIARASKMGKALEFNLQEGRDDESAASSATSVGPTYLGDGYVPPEPLA